MRRPRRATPKGTHRAAVSTPTTAPPLLRPNNRRRGLRRRRHRSPCRTSRRLGRLHHHHNTRRRRRRAFTSRPGARGGAFRALAHRDGGEARRDVMWRPFAFSFFSRSRRAGSSSTRRDRRTHRRRRRTRVRKDDDTKRKTRRRRRRVAAASPSPSVVRCATNNVKWRRRAKERHTTVYYTSIRRMKPMGDQYVWTSDRRRPTPSVWYWSHSGDLAVSATCAAVLIASPGTLTIITIMGARNIALLIPKIHIPEATQ